MLFFGFVEIFVVFHISFLQAQNAVFAACCEDRSYSKPLEKTEKTNGALWRRPQKKQARAMFNPFFCCDWLIFVGFLIVFCCFFGFVWLALCFLFKPWPYDPYERDFR